MDGRSRRSEEALRLDARDKDAASFPEVHEPCLPATTAVAPRKVELVGWPARTVRKRQNRRLTGDCVKTTVLEVRGERDIQGLPSETVVHSVGKARGTIQLGPGKTATAWADKGTAPGRRPEAVSQAQSSTIVT